MPGRAITQTDQVEKMQYKPKAEDRPAGVLQPVEKERDLGGEGECAPRSRSLEKLDRLAICAHLSPPNDRQYVAGICK